MKIPDSLLESALTHVPELNLTAETLLCFSCRCLVKKACEKAASEGQPQNREDANIQEQIEFAPTAPPLDDVELRDDQPDVQVHQDLAEIAAVPEVGVGLQVDEERQQRIVERRGRQLFQEEDRSNPSSSGSSSDTPPKSVASSFISPDVSLAKANLMLENLIKSPVTTISQFLIPSFLNS
jgi:hypothetical protein